MAFPANEIIEFKIQYMANAQVCMNVLHYQILGVPGVGNPDELTDGLIEDLVAGTSQNVLNSMLAMMSTNANMFQITGQGVWPTRFAVQRVDIDFDGTINEDLRNQNASAVIEKVGDLGQRNNVGSFHLGGMAPSNFSLGDLTNGAFALLTTLAAELLLPLSDGLTINSYIPVILNKEPIPGSDPVRYQISGGTPFLNTSPKRTARVMRRRTKGIGI